MKIQALVNQTESWAQQELNAQKDLLELLEAQERAIAAGSAEGITSSGEGIQAQLRTGPARERCRLELMRRFARAWGVAAETLTLTSIADRADAEEVATSGLRQLREELRSVGALVLRRGRRIAAMARYHQGLLAEIMGLLLDDPTGNALLSGGRGEGGALVNQEA